MGLLDKVDATADGTKMSINISWAGVLIWAILISTTVWELRDDFGEHTKEASRLANAVNRLTTEVAAQREEAVAIRTTLKLKWPQTSAAAEELIEEQEEARREARSRWEEAQ